MSQLHKLEKFLKSHSNYIILTLLIIIISAITYYRVLIQMEIGPLSDSCDFLSNALVFAGKDMGYSDLTRPPFFAFLLSIPFRMGFVSTNTIFIFDGLMYIIGVIGMYFLFKTRFSEIQSFLGALIYATFSIVLVVMSTGFADITSVSITIWTFYFLVLAVKKDSKFFYLVFPLAMMAFLTRYNNALIILPIFLYIFMNLDKIKNFRHIFGAIFISFLFLIPVFYFFNLKFGNMLYPFMIFFGATIESSLPDSAAYDPNIFFFVEKFPLFVGLDSILIIFVIFIGFIIYLTLKLKNEPIIKKDSLKKFTDKASKLKLGLLTILILLFIVSFGKISYIFSEILFFTICYVTYNLLKNSNVKNIDYIDTNLLFLAWFMVFFIFHSLHPIKDNRYFVIIAPPIAYFLLLGLSEISNRLKIKIKTHNVTFPLIATILTAIIILSTASYLPIIQQANEDTKITNEHIISACQWFENYDPNYKNKTIYADLWPFFGWYLQTNVKMMPVFKNNRTYYGGVKEFNLTAADNMVYNNELNNNKADYYFSIRPGLNLTNYTLIKQVKNLTIYKRIGSP